MLGALRRLFHSSIGSWATGRWARFDRGAVGSCSENPLFGLADDSRCITRQPQRRGTARRFYFRRLEDVNVFQVLGAARA